MLYDITDLNQRNFKWPETREGVKAICKDDGTIIHIPVDSSNLLISGTTGYGKTVITKQYVQTLLNKESDISAVFFQIKPDDFTRRFLRKNDKIISFYDIDQYKNHIFKWNIVKEIRIRPQHFWDIELEGIMNILFSDVMEEKRNLVWANAAKELFKDYIKVILYCYYNNPSNAEILKGLNNMAIKELLSFLWKYPLNRSMLRDNFEFDISKKDTYKITKKGSDIMFFVQYVSGKFAGTFLSQDGTDTLYEYLQGHYGSRLFILHDHKARESSKIFERYFLKHIIDEKLSLSSIHSKKMLLVLDEIDKIGYDIGLTEAVTLGRQFQLQVIVSTQSLNSLYAIAPEKHGNELVDAMLAGYPLHVIFHPNDPFTIDTYQKMAGTTMREILTMPISRYDHIKVSTHERSILENSDLSSLGIGECYIKYQSYQPVRVKIVLEE